MDEGVKAPSSEIWNNLRPARESKVSEYLNKSEVKDSQRVPLKIHGGNHEIERQKTSLNPIRITNFSKKRDRR